MPINGPIRPTSAPGRGAGTAAPRLALAGITKRYPGVVANSDVTLSVQPGQIHAVLGENGAGKSTLMKIIYGSVKPDAGRIAIDGTEVQIRDPQHARALGVGMVFQHFNLFDTLSVAQNVWLGLARTPGLAEVTKKIAEKARGQYVLVNNIVVGTTSGTAALACGEDYNYLSYTPLVFDHNDIYNPDGGPAYGGACPDQTGVYGNLSADPRLVSPGTGDFRLQAGSPAIDSGNNSAPMLLPTDIADAARIQDATGLRHPVIDMGAYEGSGPLDAPVTALNLTPSTYYPGQYSFFGAAPGPFTLTANLLAGGQIPAGPVTFYEDLNLVGTLPVDATGKAVLQPQVTPGLHAFLATYPGQGAFPAAVSVKFYVLFPKASPSIALTSTPNPSVLGSSVTFAVKTSSPDGTVPTPITLVDTTANATLATLTPTSSGTATFTTSALTLGTHAVTANFAGNASDNAATASLIQYVANALPTMTSLSCTPSTLALGNSSSITASIDARGGTPTGTLSLADNGTPLVSLPVTNGSATYSYSGQAAGSHTLTATFAPTSGFSGSTGSCAVAVLGLSSKSVLQVSPATTVFGDPVSLTATVIPNTPPGNGRPTGTVTFLNGVSVVGTATLVSGTANLTLDTLPVGADPLTCRYAGDTTYGPSSCNTVPVTIAAAPSTLTLTASANPSPALAPVTFTVHLSGNNVPAPTGSIVLLTLGAGSLVPIATDVNGNGTFTAAGLLPGAYPVVATVSGNASLLDATAHLTETVTSIPSTTTLSAAPNPGFVGQPVTLLATVKPAGSATNGTVTFYDGPSVLATAPVDAAGQATFAANSLALGGHSLSATFSSTAVITDSTSPVATETILPSSFAIALYPSSIAVTAGALGSTSVGVTAVGGFAGVLTLSAGALPQYASVSFKPTTVALTSGGSSSATLLIATSQEGLASAALNRPGVSPWALTFPAFLLLPMVALRKRRLGPSLALILAAIMLQTLTGCGSLRIPFHPASVGTYQVLVTATDGTGRSQSATLNLVITQ